MKKIILPLLLLCLLLTACQSGPAATTAPKKQNAPTAAPTSPTTMPPTSSAVPTEPTDPPTNTINNAKKITVGMSREDVYELLHIHGETLFQNVSVKRWDLDNGKFLYIWFHPTENSINTDLSQLPFSPDGTYLCGGFEVCDQRQSWPGDYTPSAEDVALIQEGMTLDAVFDILGIGYKEVGSGAFICQWLMDDGSTISLCLTSGIVEWIEIAPSEEDNSFSKAENVDAVSVGMTYHDVISKMNRVSVPVCINAEIVQYPLKNGGYALIWYAEIDGISTVCKVEIRSGALA